MASDAIRIGTLGTAKIAPMAPPKPAMKNADVLVRAVSADWRKSDVDQGMAAELSFPTDPNLWCLTLSETDAKTQDYGRNSSQQRQVANE